jgi:glutathionylspermidine synthase
VQVLLTEEEYSTLKELADKADNYENLHNELMPQHLALKDEYAKLLVFGVSVSSERLKSTSHVNYLSKPNYRKKGEQ